MMGKGKIFIAILSMECPQVGIVDGLLLLEAPALLLQEQLVGPRRLQRRLPDLQLHSLRELRALVGLKGLHRGEVLLGGRLVPGAALGSSLAAALAPNHPFFCHNCR